MRPIALITLASLFIISCSQGQNQSEAEMEQDQEPVEWGYSGEGAAENWGQLNPEFALCDEGVNQTPVNLTDFVEAELPNVQFDYTAAASEIVNLGKTVQVNFPEGNTLMANGDQYELLQMHVHAPSEHHLNGVSYPLEAHFVHADESGNLAVVGVFFEEGAANATLQNAWDAIPEAVDGSGTMVSPMTGLDLMPDSKDYYRYSGSLTTPPCSEGVKWIVLKEVLTMSAEQINQIESILAEPNNRPIQPVNARLLLQ